MQDTAGIHSSLGVAALTQSGHLKQMRSTGLIQHDANMPSFIAGPNIVNLIKIALLFVVTAIAEIVGCCLPWLILRQDKAA